MRRATQKRTAPKRKRTSPRKAGYTSKWDRYSLRHRKREPLCRECLRIWDRPTPAACCDHIIPVDGADDPLFWERSNHQSLCLGCHGLKSWRESQRWVVDWLPNEARIVVTGKPATGKSHYAHGLDGYDVWDMDEVAKQLHFAPSYPRPTYQYKTLLDHRSRWIDARTTHPWAVICTAVAPAYDIAKKYTARLVHCWAVDDIRKARLAARTPPQTPLAQGM